MSYPLSQTKIKAYRRTLLLVLLSLLPAMTFASSGNVPSIGPIRIEFILFGLTLLGVALFHKHTFYVALTGLTVYPPFQIHF